MQSTNIALLSVRLHEVLPCGARYLGLDRLSALGFRAMRINSPDGNLITFFVTTVRFRCQFDYSVQGNLDVG
jgi:hypothetical protein